MTNIEKMRAALRAIDDANATIRDLEERVGLDRELAELSDDQLKAIRAENKSKLDKLPAGGSMSLEKSIYLQMRNELAARSR